MSLAHFFMLMAVFVGGMVIQTVNYWLYVRATKRRVREETRQVFEPRIVRLTGEGLEQTLPELRSVHTWKGIDRVEQVSGLIFAWADNLLVLVVPARAFPSPQDAQAFLDACRSRALASVGIPAVRWNTARAAAQSSFANSRRSLAGTQGDDCL
jgi:hypothetical protein